MDLLEVNKSITGGGSTTSKSDTIECNNIKVLATGKNITIHDPVENLQTVIGGEDGVLWDGNKFYRYATVNKPDTVVFTRM